MALIACGATNALAQAMPTGWSGTNIGNPTLTGSASHSGGVFTLEGGGADIWGPSDQLYYAYRQVSGDFDVTARVTSVENTHRWAKVGLMIRGSLSANAVHASMYVTPGMGYSFQRRPVAGQDSVSTPGPAGTAPGWVKLERRGTTITAYSSTDGSTWTTVGTQTLTLPSSFYVGLADSSHNTTQLATAVFDNVSVQAVGVVDSTPPTATITAPANGASVSGNVTVSANASDNIAVTSVTFRVDGTIIGSADLTAPYSVTWNTSGAASGNHTLTAEAADAAGNRGTSAAVTVTIQAANQAPSASLTAPASGATYTAPATISLAASATDPDDGVAQVEFFAGQTLIGTDTTSPYQATWSNVAAGTYSLTAVARDRTGATTTSAATSVTVQAAGPQWTGLNIGTTGVQGTMSDNNGVLTVDGAGRDIWGTSDNFYFVYRAVSGDVDFIARVVSEEAVDPWTKAGPMVRAALTANSAHTSIFISPGNGAAFLRRPTTGGDSVSVKQSAAAPIWFKIERRGTAVTTFRSTNGTTWTMVGSETMTLPQTFYVGFAVASQNTNNAATVVFDNITVRPVNAGPQAPTVALTAPANNATFTAPATINITATAADTDDGVAQVEFFAGQTLIGTDTTSPYSVTWSNVPAGTYSLTAVARDQGGMTTTSSARTVTVTTQSSDTTAPTATVTAPANGSTVSGTVTISANASDHVGVASVTFRVDGNVVGSADTTAPYSVSWNTSGVASGSHTITAEAADAAGNRGTSAAVTVTIAAAQNQPPTVSLTAPANGATFTAPASITISANAADADGTIARVDFYNGSTLLGSDTTSPYSFAWSNVPAGTYSLTAVARDNASAQTTSAARSVTVNNAPAPTRAMFNASTNHDVAVTSYRLDIFTSGADPNTATPVQTQDLGKPAVANGAECDVNIATTIQSLPSGTYIATVTAIGPGGNARSSTSAPFTR